MTIISFVQNVAFLMKLAHIQVLIEKVHEARIKHFVLFKSRGSVLCSDIHKTKYSGGHEHFLKMITC